MSQNRNETTTPVCPVGHVDIESIKRVTGARAWALRTAGLLLLGLAAIGIVLPLMPATCFVLASAWCFARSSPRLYHWMHHNRLFGKLLRDYRDHRLIPLRVKVASVAVLWVTIGITFAAVSNLIVRVLVVAIGATITAHVGRTGNHSPEMARPAIQ
ncbi:MAG: YbaN family protein [Longimicrobiales bacterium]